jgi:hypothetical protein
MRRAIAGEKKERARRMEQRPSGHTDATMHRVLMNLMAYRNGWRVSFLETDYQTSLSRKLTFATPDKIRVMHQQFGPSQLLEDKLALDHGISIGRGGAWLALEEEQYQKLMAKGFSARAPEKLW